MALVPVYDKIVITNLQEYDDQDDDVEQPQQLDTLQTRPWSAQELAQGNLSADRSPSGRPHRRIQIDYAWGLRVLELVGNKAKLMDSFSWLSTVGGGFSSLGESDRKFSLRAGNLSLGQQLMLAEQLGDERLKIMCHIFVVLAALQLENRDFCINYLDRVILPMQKRMPHRDPIVLNMLAHIVFRLSRLVNNTKNRAIRTSGQFFIQNAIKDVSGT